MFVPFYLTILLAGAAAAVISPRIPPLSRKADTYITDQADQDQEMFGVAVKLGKR